MVAEIVRVAADETVVATTVADGGVRVGGLTGVAATAFDSGPSPSGFVAWTVTVYVVPLTRPLKVKGPADATL